MNQPSLTLDCTDVWGGEFVADEWTIDVRIGGVNLSLWASDPRHYDTLIAALQRAKAACVEHCDREDETEIERESA